MESLIEINRNARGIEEMVRVDKKTKRRVLRFLESSSD